MLLGFAGKDLREREIKQGAQIVSDLGSFFLKIFHKLCIFFLKMCPYL